MAADPLSVVFCNEVIDRIQSVHAASGCDLSTHLLEKWFKLPPEYTTVRVNYPKTAEDVLQELQDLIDLNYKQRNLPSPTVYVHHCLHDLLVIHSPAFNNSKKALYKEVVVDVHCGAALLRGADVFIPGVLGAPSDLQSGNNVSVYADLSGKCLKGMTKVYTGPKLFLGNGVAVYSRRDIFCNNSKAKGTAVNMRDTITNCPSLGENILKKFMFLQNLPSVVCSHVLDPKPTDCVLDMCAAPGGKTTHIASIMKNNGIIVALDKTKPKVEKLKSNVSLMGYSNVFTYVYDATKALMINVCDEDSEGYFQNGVPVPPPYLPGTFDCVLLDAPCSALGQRPQLRNRMTMKELESYPQLQKKLFSVAVSLLKPGGKLVYSTCSLTLEENEKIVAWALCKYPEIKLENQIPKLGGPGLEVSGLIAEDLNKLQRFDFNSPAKAEDGDTIGFFIGKFRKRLPFSTEAS